jgi:hypothetical protein
MLPDKARGRPPRQESGPAVVTPTRRPNPRLPRGTDRHCPACACRCACHRPDPEPLVREILPQPGEPFFMALLAVNGLDWRPAA